MPRDRIYRKPKSPVPPFRFDETVAGVFNDMLHRSIPLYREIIRHQVGLVRRFYQPGTRIYDLGCSNGNLGLAVCQHMRDIPFDMKAVDNSAPMLDAYSQRLDRVPGGERVDLQCSDIANIAMENASVVVLNFTLQFLPPESRDDMIQRIFHGLLPGGALLFCEKVTHSHGSMAALQQEFYYAFKKENGYTDLEISQKREALDKVLIPEPLEQHLRRLDDTGFGPVEVWLKWFNFTALLAIKPE